METIAFNAGMDNHLCCTLWEKINAYCSELMRFRVILCRLKTPRLDYVVKMHYLPFAELVLH